MGACEFTGIQIFKNLRLYPSRRVQQNGVFKNLHRSGAFLKRYVFGDRFHRVRVDGRPNRRKKNRINLGVWETAHSPLLKANILH